MTAGQATYHDYRRRHWGHDFAVTHVAADGLRLSVSGWGDGIRRGDYLVLPNRAGATRYRVEEIAYAADPPDMWHAECRHAPMAGR